MNSTVVASDLQQGPHVDREHPWPGLIAYTEQLQEYFFGRGQEVDELYRRSPAETAHDPFRSVGAGQNFAPPGGPVSEAAAASFFGCAHSARLWLQYAGVSHAGQGVH